MSAKIALAEPAGAGEGRPARRGPTVVVIAIRSPAMISGSASGSSTLPQQLALGQAHPAAGVARLRRDAVEPGR